MKLKKTIGLAAILVLPVCCFAQNSGNARDWQPWTHSNCYKNIFFRLKPAGRDGETYRWKVQFRNAYPNMISFNYFFTDDQYATDRHFQRKRLEANETSRPMDIYFQKDEVYVFIEKMSFSPYPDDIEPCDTQPSDEKPQD